MLDAKDQKDFRLEAEFFTAQTSLSSDSYRGDEAIPFVQYGTSEQLNENGEGYPVLRLNEITGGFVNKPEKFCSRINNTVFESLKLKKGDVLICRTNGNPKLVGKSAVAMEDTQFAFASYLFRVRPDTTKISAECLSVFLNSKIGRAEIEKYSIRSNQVNFSPDKIKQIYVPKLGKPLRDAIDNAVIKAYRAIRNSEVIYTQAEILLLEALGLSDWQPLQPLTYEQKASEIFGSSRWDPEFHQPGATELTNRLNADGAYKLSTLASVTNGFPWESTQFIEDGEPGEPFVRIRDCKPGVIDIEQLDKLQAEYATSQKQPKAQDGDIVVGMDGLKWFYAGLVKEPCYVNQRVAWIQPHEDSAIPSEYMMLVINSIIGQTQLLRQMTIAHTVGHITNVDVRNLLIPELTKEVRDLLSSKVRASYDARRRAKVLLEAAKRAVEIAIEDDEAAALTFLEAVTYEEET